VETISLPLTTKEYMTLLDIFQIADWIFSAHKVEERTDIDEYRKLEQKFFAYAKNMGLDNFVDFDAQFNDYSPTREYEDTSKFMDFVDEFVNDSFWDELIERLAERDLVQQEGGIEEVMKLSLEERINKTGVLQEKYAKEFEKNGIKNLTVMPRFVGGWVLDGEGKTVS
jgi:hypothetical protein